MSTFMRTIRKRKNNKINSKQAEQLDNATTKTGEITATTTPAALVDSAQNERLQRGGISDELDVIRAQQQQHKQLLQQQIKTQLDARNLCNGIAAGVNVSCCRDINCSLNSASVSIIGSLSGSLQSTGLMRESSVLNDCLRPASMSITTNGRKSRRSASASNIKTTETTATTTTTTTTTSATRKSPERDSSPDSGMGSDADSSIDDNTLDGKFTVNLRLDLFSWLLFILGFCTRFYKLTTPPNIVFDELHYGRYISLYMRHIFFFEQHPPLGKQLIAGVASLTGYDGNYTYTHIGERYGKDIPIFWLRFVPAFCGSLLAPAVYKLLLEVRLKRWTSLLGGLLIVLDNALLTQSRFVLMESMLLLFCTLGIYFLMKFQRSKFGGPFWLVFGIAAAAFLTFGACVKYAGMLSGFLAFYLMCRFLWDLLLDATVSDFQIVLQTLSRFLLFGILPLAIYLGIFYYHFQTLYRAGPHDSAMTSAFQASLEGGLASITKGQPVKVVHGSQITLRHSHGGKCWLHSHPHVYPIRYPDSRGSSHQQQVTCYTFKDVNNWWIVKRPERDDIVVGEELDVIKHGDLIQLVHGITSRALHSHDVAAPMTPQCQEVTCYIDYEIGMEASLLWRVEIVNKDQNGPIWHAIKSEVRLIHASTGAALRLSGRQLPEWGFHQHEIVADRVTAETGTIWNVEEHQYTKTQNQRERERQLLKAEMIPTEQTKLSFWEKFIEVQTKMLWNIRLQDDHMYSSTPLEWPLLDKGIAYWVDKKSSGQIHLLGNLLIWYTGTLGLLVYASFLIFYLLRRQRACYDLPPREWQRFCEVGDVFFGGYLIHYLPYFFVDYTLFLHNYFPALLFKLFLLCYVVEHVDYLLRHKLNGRLGKWLVLSYRAIVVFWLLAVIYVFRKFLALSYGFDKLSAKDVNNLRWKETWDLILRRTVRIKVR